MNRVLAVLILLVLGVGARAASLGTSVTAASSGALAPVSPSAYGGYLANEPGLAVSKAYVLDLAQYQASRVSAGIVYASTTFSAGSFVDGQQSTGSITIVQNVGLSGLTVGIGPGLYTFGGNVLVGNVSSNTAANLSAAINADPSVNAVIVATAAGSVVYATSTVDGAAYNLTLSSGAYKVGTASVTLSGAALVNGLNPGWTLGGHTMAVASNGWTLGLPLLYAAGSSPAIGGLTSQTTYYAIPAGGLVALAATSTGAVAGSYVTLTSSNAASTSAYHSYTLTPLALVGNSTMTWQSSDDGLNWVNSVSTGSIVTSSSGYTAGGAALNVDFGAYNYRYLRLNVGAPTSGGFLLQVPVYVKQDGIGQY